MGELLDIGHGVLIGVRAYQGEDCGIEIHHPTVGKPGEMCESWVPFEGTEYGAAPGKGWIVVSREPLELSPSGEDAMGNPVRSDAGEG